MNIKNTNAVKMAATIMGALVVGVATNVANVNADAIIDSNHVRVQQGDTLFEIAQKYDTDVDTLVRKNHINNKHLIHVGDKLIVKTSGKKNSNSTISNSNNANNANSANNAINASAQQTSTISAKQWIANRESGGSYTAQNGRYIGLYQLDAAYLNGDYSPANQERVADQYAQQRYGSWEAAQAFWQSHGWW